MQRWYPLGFGCSGYEVAIICKAGTYSTPRGVCVPCAQYYSSDTGPPPRRWSRRWSVCLVHSLDELPGGHMLWTSGCPFGTIAVGTHCCPSPNGVGMVLGELQLCLRGKYSTNGYCVLCSHTMHGRSPSLGVFLCAWLHAERWGMCCVLGRDRVPRGPRPSLRTVQVRRVLPGQDTPQTMPW